MKFNQNTMDLICTLEYEIGKMCSNNNSYNGWTDEYGADFRYPVTVEGIGKFRGELNGLGLKPEQLKDICYKFGSNKLYVGWGIKCLMEELEARYGLDFAELETARQNRQK